MSAHGKVPGRLLWAGALLLAGTVPASAQEPPPGSAGDTAAGPGGPPGQSAAELVFEREVFDYPAYERRNPFRILLATESGPRFEQMELRGIVHSATPGASVALMGIGGTTEVGTPGAQGEVSLGVRSHRVREGERWGNVRILEIRPTEILVEVEEFGMTEQRIMRMPTRGQGGS